MFSFSCQPDELACNISGLVEQQECEQSAHTAISIIKKVDAEKIQNKHGNQNEFINAICCNYL